MQPVHDKVYLAPPGYEPCLCGKKRMMIRLKVDSDFAEHRQIGFETVP